MGKHKPVYKHTTKRGKEIMVVPFVDYLKVVEENKKLKSDNNILNWQSDELKRLTKFISEEKGCYGKAGMLTVTSVIEIINELEEELKKKDEEIERIRGDYKNLRETHIEYVEKKVDDKLKIEKEMKEKDDIILNKNKDIDILLERDNDKDKEIERLKNLYEPEKQYEEWCHFYYEYVSENGDIKHVKQELPLEEAHNLIGMDSDNWRYYSISKYKKEVK